MSAERQTIYRMSVPQSTVCYIGRTTLPLAERLALHLCDDGGKAKRAWIEQLRTEGLTPHMESLDVLDGEHGAEAEDRQIAEHRAAGWTVLNERRAHRTNSSRQFARMAASTLALWNVPPEHLKVSRSPFFTQDERYVLHVLIAGRGFTIFDMRGLREAITLLEEAVARAAAQEGAE